MNILTKAAVQGAACGLMIGTVLLVGGRVWRPATVAAAPAVADVVKARSFAVVDAAGKVRTFLTVAGDRSTGLALYDAAGKTRVMLTLLSDGSPSLSLRDETGNLRAAQRVNSEGIPTLSLGDEAGKMWAALSLIDGPSLNLFDAEGITRAVLGTASTEVMKTGEKRTRPESSLVLFGKDGKVIWEAP